MSSFLQTLKKPYDCVLRLYSSSKTQKDISTSQRPNVFNSILSPFETYVVSLQSLLIWERPYLSAGAFVTLNIFYWLIVSWNRRFLSIVSIFALAIFLYRTWINQIWPEIRVPPPEGEDTESWTTVNPEVLSVPEISQYMNDFLDKMIILWKDVWKLRKENRGLFCALMCGFFSFMAFVGKVFPGVLIVYVLVLILTLGPGVALHLIPSTVYDQIIDYFAESDSQVCVAVSTSASKSTGTSDRDSDIEEFVPEVSDEIIRQLSLKEDIPEIPSPGVVLTESANEESLPEFGSESYINESDDFSLYQGLGAFPSVEEEGESDIEDEDISDNIVPTVEPEKAEMHFNLAHFKDDSSESESDVFTEGLSFNKNSVPSPQNSNTKEKKETPHEQRLSSSDVEDELMDFEILEESDIPPVK
ncbi:reticulophagy regulator 3 [Trichonephila clavata]|uniref:Reticulophagy regulator 3 n=1 Tax=Trichonephila clavata TaxID=2740835 RepID=A0A8X6L5G0_TRICU|nr:reticulophagy regulator 3 [Trichonephila clavata]